MILRACKRGSLTIEAAVIIPAFVLGLLAMVSVISVKREAMDIQEELFCEAMDVAIDETDGAEYRKLDIRRELFPLTRAFGPLSVTVERKCLVHVWNGYGRGYYPDDEIVFVTKDSEVYHRDRNCSHLKLSVREVTGSEVPSLRNESGSRYKSCGICHSRLSDGKLYITAEGDRYHNSITCSGLKRTVYAVYLSEVKDNRPCSRCGR